MSDFNIRHKYDEHYNDSPETSISLDLLLQELDILFNTKEETILGDLDFGLRLGQFLWKTNNNDRYISAYIQRKINNSCYMAEFFTVGVDMKILKGQNNRDIGVVDISISGGDNSDVSRNIQYILR